MEGLTPSELRRVAVFLTDVEINERKTKMFQDVIAGVLGVGSFTTAIGGLGYFAATFTVATGGLGVLSLGAGLAVGLFFAGKYSKGEM